MHLGTMHAPAHGRHNMHAWLQMTPRELPTRPSSLHAPAEELILGQASSLASQAGTAGMAPAGGSMRPARLTPPPLSHACRNADGNAGQGRTIVQMTPSGQTSVFATIPNNPPPPG